MYNLPCGLLVQCLIVILLIYYTYLYILYFTIYFITHSEYRFYYNLQKLLVFKIQILQQIRFNKFQFYYKLQPIGRFIKFFLYHF